MVLETKIKDHFSIQICPQLVRKMTTETTFGHWKVFFSVTVVRKSAFFLKKLSWPDFQTYSSWTRKIFLNCPHQHFSAIFLEQYVSFFNFSPPYCSSPQVKKDDNDYSDWNLLHMLISSSVHLLRWRKAAVQSFAMSPLATQSQRFTGPERWYLQWWCWWWCWWFQWR